MELNLSTSAILVTTSINYNFNDPYKYQENYAFVKEPIANFSLESSKILNDLEISKIGTTTSKVCLEVSDLPPSGTKEEVNNSLNILLMLFVIALCFLEIYVLLRSNFHFVPESFIVVATGAALGLLFSLINGHLPGEIEGNFFRNIGSILVFAIIGTAVSAFIVGGCLFLMGKQHWIYELSFTESFALGSFLSAVDPVATLAVFHALDVEPVLNMLVVGESILNDAVAIVLSSAVWEASKKENLLEIPISHIVLECFVRFFVIFTASAIVGVTFALIAALLFKHVELWRYPSLEFGMMLIFIYSPYCLAEVLQLSGFEHPSTALL